MIFRLLLPLLLVCSCLAVKGQDYPQGFLLLRGDSIVQLNKQSNGSLNFILYYQADFLDSIAAIAYHESDEFWYAISTPHAHIIRFQPNGFWEDLGVPVSYNQYTRIPKEDFISATIEDQKLYVASYSSNTIFCIDLTRLPLTYSNLVHLPYRLTNTLNFDPQRSELLIFHPNGGSIFIHPERKTTDIYSKQFKNFQRKSFLAYGKTWFNHFQEAFILHHISGKFAKIDLENKVIYPIAAIGFNSPKDAMQCPTKEDKVLFPNDLLHFEAYPHEDQHSIQLEWKQGASNNVLSYELQALRPDEKGWTTLKQFPAYNAQEQSGRYAALDRLPQKGEQTYRLRISQSGGYSRYSSSIYLDWLVKVASAKLRLSPNFINSDWPFLHLQAKNLYNQQLNIRLYQNTNQQLVWTKDCMVKAEDEHFSLHLPPLKAGWYWAEVISGKQIKRFSVYLNTIN